ncbi:hypothetical protein Avbf_09196 [Armadillidium vulgare]|nr:hypothetical protein Avbf_09196 [Armadillidium vulgare]
MLQLYSHDFQVTYQNGSTFSHIWSTGLTHNNLNQGSHADELNLKYLKSLNEDGILNKTIFFFISDHGMRHGKFRETDMGRHEENLPYLFIVVPEWFHESFPVASKNLQENTLKFSTPLDVYETLKDILKEKYKDKNYLLKNPRECQKRISLFQQLSLTRTCTEIGMPLQYCSCQKHVQLKDTGWNLRYFPKCSKIKRLEVIKAFKSLEEVTYSGTVDLVSVQALYNPGNALIETTLMWDKTNENLPFTVSGEISRINKYGNQSECVTDKEIVKICVCKDMT